ncbi:MAG: NADH-quinone oxidoreductase subunit H, partial [Polyangiaceae bacterium]
MSGVLIVLALIKILIMVGFLLNMAAIATWADRRQGAMVQDRVGPNRAVVFLPSIVVQLLFVLPPALFATLAGFTAYRGVRGPGAAEAALMGAELAIFVGWFSLLVLCFVVRRKGAANALDEMVGGWAPRSILVTGLALHVAAFVALSMVPAGSWGVAARGMNGLLALVFAAVGIYSASKVPEGKVGIRLAGTLHAIADTMKMIWKEDFIPPRGDRLLHSLAPILAVFPVLVTCAVIPFGRTLCFRDANG